MTTATMTSNTAMSAGAGAGRGGFFNALASEWLKLVTLRSTHVTLGLGLVLSITSTAIVGIALGSTQDSWSPDFNPITTSMFGTIFGLIIYSVFGVTVASREYASGTMRLTLSATPNRTRVFVAKLTIVGVTVLLFGLATTIGMFFAGQAVMGAYGMPTASLTDRDALRMVLGLGVVMPFFPVMGLGFGILLRSTAGGITTVLGLLWLPQIFGEIVPLWFRENILNLLPSNGVDSMTIGHIEPSPAFSDPAIGAVITAAWLLAVLGTAYIAFVRRDA